MAAVHILIFTINIILYFSCVFSLSPPILGFRRVRGEVGLGDYPRIPQVINEIKGFAKIYLTKGIRLKTNFIPPPLHPLPLNGGVEGGWGALLISLPSSIFIGLSESFKIFGVQGILGSLFLPCVNA